MTEQPQHKVLKKITLILMYFRKHSKVGTRGTSRTLLFWGNEGRDYTDIESSEQQKKGSLL